MKILILGSVALPVPPPMQGGTERIAYWQAVGLAKRGHDVTLIAARGSTPNPSYRLIEIGGGDTVTGSSGAEVGVSLISRRQGPDQSPAISVSGAKTMTPLETKHLPAPYTEGSRMLRKEAIYLAQVEQFILDHGIEYDLILNNMRAGETLFVPVAKTVGVRYATVMHLPMFAELADFFIQTKTSVITISNAQRVGFEGVNYVGTVYNTMDLGELEFRESAGEYLLIMGSIAPHKNQKEAILAAKKLGKRLIIAGKIGNQAYFDAEIKQHIDTRHIELRGEMGKGEKATLLSHAEALLFPIRWPEPFGLVMIEAMASGTPVIAYRNGAVPEVVRDGVTGFVVDPDHGVDGLASAINRITGIDRSACRRHVEANFSMTVMLDSLEDALSSVARL